MQLSFIDMLKGKEIATAREANIDAIKNNQLFIIHPFCKTFCILLKYTRCIEKAEAS